MAAGSPNPSGPPARAPGRRDVSRHALAALDLDDPVYLGPVTERTSRKIPVTERQFLWVQDDDKGEVTLHVGPTMVSPTAADRGACRAEARATRPAGRGRS